MISLIQGEDKILQFDLKDAAGNAVNFADLPEVNVMLSIDGQAVFLWSKTVQSGKARVIAVIGNPSRCKVVLSRIVTQYLPEGRIAKLEITTFQTDADIANNRAETTQATMYKIKARL
jgi:hypothetical protein